MTKRLLSVFTLLMMLMMTSLSAHAVSYYIAGDFTNWGTGKVEMTSDGQGQWVLPAQAVTAGQQFKVVKVDGETTTWYGYNNYHVSSNVVLNGTTIDVYTDNGNLDFQISGIFRFVLTENGDHPSLVISYVPQPVTVKSGIVNGTLEVDKTQALPGETITITATPDPGYYVEVGNVKVEKTVNGDVAQAPGLKTDAPGVGSTVDVVAGEAANTFTFAMPESPYGAKVSAEFQACIPITAAMIQPNPIPDQDYTGSQIKPAIVVMDGETTLVEGTDYTLEYGANVEPGEGTIIVTGKGKYTSTVTVTFTIKKGVHNVNVTSDGNGTVAAEPLSAVQGTDITLTITPNEGYELDKLTVGGTEVTVTGNTYTFEMPDADVAVNATFKKVDYTITVTSNEYGTVTVNDNKTTANFGDNITLTLTPKEDCVLQELKVDGQVVEVEGNTYTFTMPSHNVAVEATFRALEVSYEMRWGKGSPWSDQHSVELTPGTEGKLVAENNSIAAEYEAVLVKIVDGQEVLLGAQSSGDFYINDNTLGQPISMGTFDGGHFNLYFPNAGIYNFSYDPAGKTLVVTGDYLYNITVTNPATEVTVDKTTAKAGETVTITVLSIPEGYEIDAVKVNDGAVEVILDEETGKYTFAMPASNATVTVTFKAATYTITVAENIENGTVEAPASAQYGTEVNVTVTPDPGYEVEALTYTVEGGEAVPIENNKFTMPAGNVTINATFKKATYTVTVTNPNTEVTVDKATAQMGDKVTITITPAAGYEVDQVSVTYGDNQSVEVAKDEETGKYTFTMPAANVTVAVTFKKTDYTITVADIQNGTVEPSKTTANVGDVITLEVTPLGDYELETLTYTVEGGQPVTIENNQFTMPAGNVTINATFTALPVTYKINYGKQGNPWTETGSITMTKDETTGKWVTEGQVIPAGFEAVLVKMEEGKEDVTMQAFATDQYWITDANLVQNEPINMGTGQGYVNIYFPKAGNYTFTYNPVDKKMLVGGNYVYNINIAETTNGTVTTDPVSPVAAGTQVTINATPVDENYRVESITVTYGEGENITTVPVTDNKFEMPAADVTINATFTRILHNNPLTWNVPEAKGAIEVKVDDAAITSGTEVQEGKTVVVTVTPTAEWTVNTVTVDCGNSDLAVEVTKNADGTYTFTMPAAPAEIKVDFTAVQHGITITPNEFVTVTTDPAGEAAAGQEVTVTVTPNNPNDFVVGGVKVNGESIEPNADGTYTFTMPEGADGVTIDVVVEAKIQGVSFTAERNWATYIGAYNLVKPEGIKVYVVNGVVSDAVDITEIDYIPANVGVLLYGTVGEDLTTPLYTGETGTPTSKLAGSATASQEISAGYVLYNNNFIRSEEGTLAAHRCYLPASEVQGAPRMLKIGYDGDVPTAIESLMAEGNVAKVMYVNMSGLTSDKPFRGVNIAVVTFTDGSTHTIKLVK